MLTVNSGTGISRLTINLAITVSYLIFLIPKYLHLYRSRNNVSDDWVRIQYVLAIPKKNVKSRKPYNLKIKSNIFNTQTF